MFAIKERGAEAEPIFDCFLSLEATAVWQWFHFLQSQVPPSDSVLRLNLDETSIKFWYEPRMGLRRPAGEVPRVGFARQASRSQLRRASSHIAIICDDTGLQPHLPQVLLVNERTVTPKQHRRWPHCQAAMPSCGVKSLHGLTTRSLPKLYESLTRS